MREDLFLVLAFALRAALDRQLADILGRSLGHIRRKLRETMKAGLVDPIRVFAVPPVELLGPLVVWRPGDPLPDCGRLSWLARKRAVSGTPRSLVAWVATPKLASLVGGRCGPLPRPLQASHDLHCSSVLVAKCRAASDQAWTRWRCEDVLEKPKRGFRPDAVIVDETGKPTTAVDYLGHYSEERVLSVFRWASQKGIECEAW